MSYNALLVLQSIALTISFAGILYMLKRKASFEQKLMLIIVVCIFVYNAGATLLLMNGDDPESAMMCLRFGNVGKAYLTLLLLLFVVRYLGKRIWPILYGLVFVVENAVALFSVFLFDSGLYYKNITYSVINGIPGFETEYATMTYIDLGAALVIIGYCIVISLISLKQCHDSSEKKRITALLGMVLLILVFEVTNEFLLAANVDAMPIFLAAALVYVIVMTERFDLFDIVVSARDRVFETMPDVIFAFDEKFILRDINTAGTIMFPDIAGCVGEEIPEKYRFLLKNTDDKMNFKHNGIHFERHFSPIFYRGRLTGYCMMLVDVTHAHQMMLQLRELKNRADIASESKNAFLARMSHEIRTPMNAIIGYSDLISKEVSSSEGLEYADAIRSSSNSLLHIINDILDFSKIEQGNLEIVEEEYMTERLFAEVTDIMNLQAQKKGLKLISSVEPDIPAILYGDRMRIRQVLVNIVSNAIQYTREGSVRINTEWERGEDDYANLSIIVSDTGIGIRPEDVKRLFKEFEQVDMRTYNTKSGIGLGLSIAKALLEMMGGTVNIESEYGIGTSVIINLKQKIIDYTPMSSMPALSRNESGTKQALIAPDARILVVDDNRVNLELMNNYLKQYRIIPELVESGRESVECAANNYYDIIFMDQMMPEMDGIEAMKKIREQGGRNANTLPIIALTANAIAGTRNMLIAEGFTDYASKPLPIRTLEYLLVKYLPKGTYTISADTVDSSAPIMSPELLPGKHILELPDYIDQDIGMKNSGDDFEQYRTVIGIVYKYAGEKIERVRELYEKRDIENYTIEVHALKSNAATVGAMRLSDLARSLEEAGKKNNLEIIERDTNKLIDSYTTFADDLRKCLEHEDTAASAAAPAEQSTPMDAGDDEYVQTFEEIASAIGDGRYEDAGDLFGVLEFFELPPVIAHAVDTMRGLYGSGEWKTILEILAKMK